METAGYFIEPKKKSSSSFKDLYLYIFFFFTNDVVHFCSCAFDYNKLEVNKYPRLNLQNK